jgi:hypothetical protein
MTPLYAAAVEGHLKVSQYLGQHLADKNKAKNGGITPLRIAATKGLTWLWQTTSVSKGPSSL